MEFISGFVNNFEFLSIDPLIILFLQTFIIKSYFIIIIFVILLTTKKLCIIWLVKLNNNTKKKWHSANKIKSPKRSNTFWCLFTVSKALNDNLVISVVSLYYHGVINATPNVEHRQPK